MTKPINNTNDHENAFSEEETASFTRTMQHFKDGITTARNWEDIDEDLNHRYKTDSVIKSVKSSTNR